MEPFDACSSGTQDAYYRGHKIALLTQHGKETVIAPVLEAALGCRVERVEGFDTDRLGTFTHEIPRAGTQLEAARKKARIGMELSGLPLGLASEGAFGPDPFTGLLSWNLEFLIFIDNERSLEVVGMAQGKANFNHLLTAGWPAAEAFALQYGFPEHHLVVRPESEQDPRFRKGITTMPELKVAFDLAVAQSQNGKAFIEVDLRANANPTRMDCIRLAAEDLAKRLRSFCPACGIPGFWLIKHLPGLPCEGCGAPTRERLADVHGCPKCSHQLTHERTDRHYADPVCCEYCNP